MHCCFDPDPDIFQIVFALQFLEEMKIIHLGEQQYPALYLF